jgi:hypothetical protein
VALAGVVAVWIWAAARTVDVASSLAFGLLIMGSAGLVGGIIGLLFGIPKTRSDPGSVGPSPADNAAKLLADPNRRSGYDANTNLEQISDWLTKIIVGVSLTELPTIRAEFHKAATYLGDGFVTTGPQGAAAAAPLAAALILVYGLTGGFLAGYLLTRIFLQGAFERLHQVERQNVKLRRDKESTQAVSQKQAQIYTDLYNFEKQGFRDAIRQIRELFKAPINKKNPALWAYLAAAHGQAYRWEDRRDDKDPEKAKLLYQHRKEAFEAARQAIALQNAWKPALQLLWNPNHETKAAGTAAKEENDLELFYDFPEFKKLLGDGN